MRAEEKETEGPHQSLGYLTQGTLSSVFCLSTMLLLFRTPISVVAFAW